MNEEFIGTEALKDKHTRQIVQFEKWAIESNWIAFHSNHYDWWTYPINRRSAYGDLYKLTSLAIDELKADEDFIHLHRRGIQLGALAWGWDILLSKYINNPGPSQCWSNWPVRLNKMGQSAKLFGLTDLFTSLCIFATDLKRKGESFDYCGKDMYSFFVQ